MSLTRAGEKIHFRDVRVQFVTDNGAKILYSGGALWPLRTYTFTPSILCWMG